jgi:hypothetical protein
MLPPVHKIRQAPSPGDAKREYVKNKGGMEGRGGGGGGGGDGGGGGGVRQSNPSEGREERESSTKA